ncbi:MAG: TonB-dependent receptor [Sulfuricurvum sp.]|nr:TonB-dependent receptor [Sulfuricurvum sp.]
MKLSKISLSACAVLALSSLVMAQEVSDINTTESTMESISVTQKRPTVVVNNPSNNAHVSASDIEKINVINVEDALKYVPSLHIRKRYIGDRNSIISTRTSGTIQSALSLVYADGLLLSNLLGNSYAFPPRWALVGTSELESVDVLYGPFSALLPGNSEGATVIMTTKRPEKFEASADVTAFTEDFSLFGTNESFSGHQEQARIANKHGNLSWEIFANHLDSYGHPMTFATAAVKTAPSGVGTPVSGYHKYAAVDGTQTLVFGATSIDHSVQDTVKTRLVYDLDQYNQVALTAAKFYLDSYSNSETYLRDASGNPVYSGSINIEGHNYTLSNTTFGQTKTKTENNLIGLTLNSKLSSQWRTEIAGSIYTTPKDIARTPSVAKPTADVIGAGSITFGDDTGWKNLDLRAIYKSSETKPDHTLTLGYHYDGYEMASKKYNVSNWMDEGSITSYNSGFLGKTQTQALYAQDVWHVAQDWSVTAGLRAEQWKAFDGSRDVNNTTAGHNDYTDRKETLYSPKLSISWDFSDDWTARFSMAKAYRMPTVGELFQTETRGSTIFFSEPNLKPENIFSKELTLENTLEQGYARFSFFDQEVKDMIFSQTDVSVIPNVTSQQNLDKTRIYGVEAAYGQGGFMNDLLEIGGSLTLVKSQIVSNSAMPTSQGKWIPRIPNIRLTTYGTYHISSALDATIGYRYSGKQYGTLDNSDVNRNVYGSSSAFSVLDAKLGYKVGKNLQAFIGVDNLTNCEYYAYHPYAQRTYSAQLKYTY